MIKLDFLIAVLFLTFSQGVFAQNKAVSKANKLYKEKLYAEAIPFFEEVVAETPSLTMRTKLAFCYKVTNNLEKAEAQYATLVYDDKVRIVAFKHYAEVLMGQGKYAAAKFWLDEYLKEKPEDAQAKVLLRSCDEVYNIKPYFLDAEVRDYAFNTEFDDNGAVLNGDRLYFTSDNGGKGKTNSEGRGYMSIYESIKEGNDWSEPKKMAGKFNAVNNNSGPVSFNRDGTIAIFCKNAPVANKKGQYPLQIFLARLEEGKWKTVERPNFCKIDNNYFQAAISPDGNTIVFSSDSGRGQGKADLFYSKKTGEKWGLPVNLGVPINTAESEGFPFIDKDGNLYFCSKGHLGYGGYDLYVSKVNSSGIWGEPTNLGFPINGTGDEMSIFLNEDSESGIFSSTRNGGNDDLFFFGADLGDKVEEEEIPDFAKAGFKEREEELKREKELAAAKAKEEAAAKEKAIAEAALEKEKAEAARMAEIEAERKAAREARLAKEQEALMAAKTEKPYEPTKIERSTELSTINAQSEKAKLTAGGDTLYVGKKIETESKVAETQKIDAIEEVRTPVSNKPPEILTEAETPKAEKPQLEVNDEIMAATATEDPKEVETPKVAMEAPAEKNTPPVVEKEVATENPEPEIKEEVIAAVEEPKAKKPKKKKDKEKAEKKTQPVVEEEVVTENLKPEVKEEVVAAVEEPKAKKPKKKKDKEKVEKKTPPVVEEVVVAENTEPEVKEEVVAAVEEPKSKKPKKKKDKVKADKMDPPAEEEVIAEVETPKAEAPKKVNKSPKKDKKAKADVKVAKVPEPPVSTPPPTTPTVPTITENAPRLNEIGKLKSDLSSNNAKGKKYALEDLKYTFNATQITEHLEAPLIELANILRADSNLKIKLIGHTASIGGDEKNQRLSVGRAAAAVDFLISKGADPQQLTYDGRGETEIMNGCHDGVLCGRAQHQENERIEIEVQ